MIRKNSIDLWTPRFPEDRLHQHFRVLASTPSNRDCIDRWAAEFDDADNKIVEEFQLTFSPAFWELYLHTMFRSFGFAVRRPSAHPDFLLDTPQGLIAAEAKVTQAGPNQMPEWTSKVGVPFNKEQFYQQTTAKLSGAVRGKIDSYRRYSSDPSIKGCPFLLCLGPYDHPWFVVQHARAIWRVLYQYDQPIGHVSAAGNMIEIGHARVETFSTASGAVVPLGHFLDRENSDISAVFFNPRATVSKLFSDPLRLGHEGERVMASWYSASTGTFVPQDVHPSRYRETLADGGYLLLNPYAQSPVDPDPFFAQGITVCSFDPDGRQMTSRNPEPFLFERVTLGVLQDEFPADMLAANGDA